MRAAVMRRHALVVDDVPEPEPRTGEVLVKTLACGICGSDLHALAHGERLVDATRRSGGLFEMDLARDVVLGHEFCAEVLDFGPGTARTLKPGTRVCSLPVTLGPAGIEAVGYSNDNPGGYGELMRLSEALLLPVPDGLPTEHAALTEPMAVGLHAVAKARLDRDDVPLVVGCGPVGLAVIAALALRGASPIVATDFSPRRRELATAMGAHVFIDPAANSPYERWAEVAPWSDPSQAPPRSPFAIGPPLRPAVIFECVGVPGVIDEILRGAPSEARVIVVGVCMEQDRIEPMFGINKELNLQFVLGYTPEEFAATLRHIAEGELPVEPLITGTVGIEGVAGAFEALASPEQHAKILVEPSRG
jgi:threonine dehydrogenase-like Zn-dependent dehydrogenase